MAMPQRDDTIEAIKRLDACGRLRALRVRRWRISPPKRSFCGASLEYAVMHGDEEVAERIREELTKLVEGEGVARQGLRNIDCVELTRWAQRWV